MNARVRSPGSSAAETASAAARRELAIGRLQAAQRHVQRQLLVVERDPQRGDHCSPNSRLQALWLAIAFSARIFSSGSVSRWGR